MNHTIARVLLGSLVVAVAVLAAAAQDRTRTPGEMTQAKVWIQNRGSAEAVPVSIRHTATEPPLPVQVTGTPTVLVSPSSVVQARAARSRWEYREVSVLAGQNVVDVLNGAGAEGWEAVGVPLGTADRTVVLMKRPT